MHLVTHRVYLSACSVLGAILARGEMQMIKTAKHAKLMIIVGSVLVNIFIFCAVCNSLSLSMYWIPGLGQACARQTALPRRDYIRLSPALLIHL